MVLIHIDVLYYCTKSMDKKKKRDESRSFLKDKKCQKHSYRKTRSTFSTSENKKDVQDDTDFTFSSCAHINGFTASSKNT